MKTENVDLMKMARQSLEGKWSLAIGGAVVYFLILALIQAIPKIGPLASLFITGPLMGGIAVFYLSISRKREAEIEQLFQGFNNFGTFLGVYWLMILYIFLWTLLLIVPGIIAALSYAMTFYIIADDDSIGISEALKKSRKMMDGNKWKYFCLGWRFFGWAILSVLSFGIGFLWLIPYMQVSFAKFYDDLRREQQQPVNETEEKKEAEPAIETPKQETSEND